MPCLFHRYSMPFLSKRCHPNVNKEHVSRVYRMFADIDHPTLFYVGLTKRTLLFRTTTLQAELALGFLTGRIPQPSKKEMLDEYQYWYRKLVTEPGKSPHYFHIILPVQAEYYKALEKQTKTTEPIPGCLFKMMDHWDTRFGKTLMHMRDGLYKTEHTESDDFEIIYEKEV